MRTFLLAILIFALPAFAVDRSTTERYRFAQKNPCPANGERIYALCPGWNINHATPICAGGPDTAANMEWARIDVKKSKDAIEHAACACVRKHGKDACPEVKWGAPKKVKP